jgi:hypothetical protein
LVRHRFNPACASCHARFDPIGFGLESYDVIGGWRDRYRISPQKGTGVSYTMLPIVVNQREYKVPLGKNVDTADRLPNGQIFANLEGLKRILLNEPDQITRGLAEKLLIYSTGQSLEYVDQPMVRNIVKKVKAKNYGFRSLIHEVVASDVFQGR